MLHDKSAFEIYNYMYLVPDELFWWFRRYLDMNCSSYNLRTVLPEVSISVSQHSIYVKNLNISCL